MKLFHNGMSVCAQKVRLALAEKGLAYESVILDLQKGEQFSPQYIRLNPGRVVPTLEVDGHVYVESTLINEYIDDVWPTPALRPENPDSLYRMRRLVKLIDDQVHQSCGVITYAIALRTLLQDRPKEEVEAMTRQIPDPVRRHNRRLVLEHGIDAEPFAPALASYLSVLAIADASLQRQPWCAGSTFSLADCALLPYVLRLDHLQLLPLLKGMPALLGWYSTMQARSSWQTAIANQLPVKALALFDSCGKAAAERILTSRTG